MVQCERELDNKDDGYAVDVKHGTTIDNLSWWISHADSEFVQERGKFTSRVSYDVNSGYSWASLKFHVMSPSVEVLAIDQ